MVCVYVFWNSGSSWLLSYMYSVYVCVYMPYTTNICGHLIIKLILYVLSEHPVPGLFSSFCPIYYMSYSGIITSTLLLVNYQNFFYIYIYIDFVLLLWGNCISEVKLSYQMRCLWSLLCTEQHMHLTGFCNGIL